MFEIHISAQDLGTIISIAFSLITAMPILLLVWVAYRIMRPVTELNIDG